MNAHTPGPWIARDQEPERFSRDIHGPGRELIAHVLYENAFLAREADVRLIAAAPDLLAACQAFVQSESELFALDPLRAEAQPNHPVQRAWLLARAAVARAEGGGL